MEDPDIETEFSQTGVGLIHFFIDAIKKNKLLSSVI